MKKLMVSPAASLDGLIEGANEELDWYHNDSGFVRNNFLACNNMLVS